MAERDDLIEALQKHRWLLKNTARELNDEQAAERTTVSELCIGGLIKHVAAVEERWVKFIEEGPSAMAPPADPDFWPNLFRMLDGETLAGLIQRYDEVAGRTDSLIRTVDLDLVQTLPDAPWRPPNTSWSTRRVLLHIIAETSQHAGHADIIREALDGAKSMG